MIYLNHAGTSWPKPPSVVAAMRGALDLEPTEYPRVFEQARQTVCSALGIDTPERFLFTPGCTAALALALEELPWGPDDVILTSSLEHHALIRPIELLGRLHGVVHEAAPYRPDEPIDLEYVERVLEQGAVRLVAFSGASNVTGEVLPIRELAQLAHDHGALCLLDAAQVMGVVPLDVAELGIDMLCFAGHKGPLGPQGIGGFWAAPDVAFHGATASCDIGAEAVANQASKPAPFPGYCDVGGVNLPGAAGLAAGIEHWNAGEMVGEPARTLATRFTESLAARPHCHLLGGTSGPHTGARSLLIDGLPLEQAESHFRKHDVIVRAGSHCAPLALEALGAAAGTIRVSFGWNSTEASLERVLTAIDAV